MSHTDTPPEIDGTSHDQRVDAAYEATASAYLGTPWADSGGHPPAVRYLALKDLRDAARALDKAVGQAMAQAEADVKEWMVDNATDRWRNPNTGQGVHIRHEIRASVKVEHRPAAVLALREVGAGTLVEQTVNANTLSSWVREQVDTAITGAVAAEAHDRANALQDDPSLALPPALRPYITVTPLTKLGTSKSRA
jgi:hypothetical protein